MQGNKSLSKIKIFIYEFSHCLAETILDSWYNQFLENWFMQLEIGRKLNS